MFTGIIEAIGTVRSLREVEAEWRLEVSVGTLGMGDVALGDSIAVSGCCLTVVEFGDDYFAADVSNETLRCTSLGDCKPGSRVNLEKAMQATDRFGGHIVSGHVDGVGVLANKAIEGKSWVLDFEVPEELSRYVAAKGSICIDGTSLTVNSVEDCVFSINVIPHTQQETIIGGYAPGVRVNLEVDLVARYLERLLQVQSGGKAESGVTLDLLQKSGFSS